MNLSNFFDRCSGGDGSGNLGVFQMIGDIYYVTTNYPKNHYSSDGEVLDEILETLDDPNFFDLDFVQYDNWRFQKNNELYNHEYLPGVGDGKLDNLICIWRGTNTWDFGGGYLGLDNISYLTNDGISITDECGSMTFNAKNSNLPNLVANPAHEYCHYLFGGGQYTGHFDGYSYWNTTNRGRINRFGLMCALNAGWMSAYERYRLGWLNPIIIEQNTSYINLRDTHKKNEAIIIPMRYENNQLMEYYLVENYHTTNDYPEANPFLKENAFNNSFSHGLLVFHIENESYNIATETEINIESADGRWQYKLSQGANTPYDQSDDYFTKDYPTYNLGWDERHYNTITVPPLVYNNYVC